MKSRRRLFFMHIKHQPYIIEKPPDMFMQHATGLNRLMKGKCANYCTNLKKAGSAPEVQKSQNQMSINHYRI
jgi:hypothetical protein